MNTRTPRDDTGKFNSWNDKVEDAGSYNTGQDAVIVVLALAVGAALWEAGKWCREKISE